MKNFISLFTIIIALCNSSVHAKVIVVSDKMPQKDVYAKLNVMQAGDTLLLKEGYYKLNIKLKSTHGDVDKPIVIRGENRTKTTIDGGAIKPGSNLINYGIHLENCSWITIDNLSFKNCWTDAVRADNSSYISLINSNIDGSRRALFAQGRKSHHFLIENCYWEQGEHVWTKENKYSWAELHHGEFRHYNGSIFQAKMIGGSFVIRDNYIKNVYNGIRLSIMGDAESDTLACTNGEIYRNVIENSADNAFEPEVYCKNLHFYHNKMINSHAFISVTEVAGGPLYFYGNTGVKLPDCKDGWTIFKFVGKERRLSKPIYIFNNSWQVDSDVLGRIQEPHWHNDNIYHFNNAYHITNADTVGIYYLGKNNRFENDCANIPFPDKITSRSKHKSLLADPMFVDGKYGSFLLDAASPCRNGGIIPEDIRISFTGDKLDIGAYDDDRLVEGPPFRYENPGVEMGEQEKPRIVRHKIEGKQLKLWFSYQLKASTIQAKSFELNGIPFESYTLLEDGYLLVLESVKILPSENVSLSINQKPRGINNEEVSLWASTISAHSVSKADQALNIVKKVADNLMVHTSFDFEPKVVTFNAGVTRLSIASETLNNTNQVVYALSNINTKEEKTAIFGFSFRGDIKVFLNNNLIYTGKSDVENFREYTYNRFEFDNSVQVNLQKGNNQLLIKCRGRNGNTSFASCIQKPNGMFDNEVQIRNNIDNSHINNWLITGPFVSDYQKDVMNSVFEPEHDIREYYQQNGRIISWQMQNPMIQQSLVVPHNQTNKKGFSGDWHYANSNTLLGVLNLYKASDDYRYKQFVEMYNKQVVVNYDFFKDQYFSKRILRGTYFRLFRATMLDDTGGAILPFAEAALTDQIKGLQLDILNQTLDYVLHKQSRLDDGTLCRPEPVDKTVWADDLFMSVPFLMRMAKVNNDPKLYDEAAFQTIKINTYLTDKQTGLCRHGWYDLTKELSPVAWSRANGWLVWATSEILMDLPVTHKEYENIRQIFVKHMQAVLSYQSESGLWHQVIDRPDSYLETSGTAMFALALSRGIRHGWISESYAPQLLKAWNAVCSQIDTEGNVNGICRGTDMGKNSDYYMNQKPLLNDPRGLGAVLTLGSEMFYYFKSKTK